MSVRDLRYAKLQAMAQRENRSMHNLIIYLLRQGVERAEVAALAARSKA